MAGTVRDMARGAMRPMLYKLAGRPVGIWAFWLCLIYAAYSFAPKLWLLAKSGRMTMPILSEIVAVWIPFIAAAIALAMRRRIAQLFGGISMAFLLYHATFHRDRFGMVLAVLGFVGLLANRRWFYERLPNLEK